MKALVERKKSPFLCAQRVWAFLKASSSFT